MAPNQIIATHPLPAGGYYFIIYPLKTWLLQMTSNRKKAQEEKWPTAEKQMFQHIRSLFRMKMENFCYLMCSSWWTFNFHNRKSDLKKKKSINLLCFLLCSARIMVLMRKLSLQQDWGLVHCGMCLEKNNTNYSLNLNWIMINYKNNERIPVIGTKSCIKHWPVCWHFTCM